MNDDRKQSITFFLPGTVKAALAATAADRKMSVSEATRAAVEFWLSTPDKDGVK